MGRMRTMKPEFFRSRSLGKLPRDARLLFAGLWTESDDHGNGIADGRLLKGAIFPYDDDLEHEHVFALLCMLAASSHIQLYAVGDETYFHIINFVRHQAPAYRRGGPKYPGIDAGQPLDPGPAHKSVQESAPRTQNGAVTGNREQVTGNRDLGARSESHSPAHASARDRAAALSGKAHSPTAHKIVADFSGRLRRRPPTRVRNDLAVEVDDLLAEDWPPELIHRALDAWSAKGLDPRKLASVANEVANRDPVAAARAAPARPSTTDQRVAAAQALKASYAAGATQGATVLQLPSGDQR